MTSLSKYIAKTSLILMILFLNKTESNSCNFNVKLAQTLHNEGFHRNITYEVQFGVPHGNEGWYDGCSVGLEQMLPVGIYASPDEIDNAKYKTATVFKNKVNIESPAHEASIITIHLLSSVKDDKTFLFLPVHARYHKAVEGGGTARVDIPPPYLYINCGSKMLEQCPPTLSDNNAFCPENSKQKCLWKEVAIKVSEPLAWHVPVGNTDHHNLVMFGTAAVVVFSSLYLLKEIHCYKLRQQKMKKIK